MESEMLPIYQVFRTVQVLMQPHKIVVREVQRDGRLAEGVR
jgi:hypothetical protein